MWKCSRMSFVQHSEDCDFIMLNTNHFRQLQFLNDVFQRSVTYPCVRKLLQSLLFTDKKFLI